MVLLHGKDIPTDNVHHTEKDTSLSIEGNDVGTGTLYITESSVIWLNSTQEGVELQYRMITLHAVSRDLASFPHEHLLLHYEGKIPGVETNRTDEDDGDEDEDFMECQDEDGFGPLIEVRFVPQNKESLDGMFQAMSNCQVLHPDPNDDCVSDEGFSDAEEGGGDAGFFTGQEGFQHLSEEGQANLERFNNMLQMGQGDADITSRTGQITLNGHHNGDDETEQFQDADRENMND